jgi:hypothetical protein
MKRRIQRRCSEERVTTATEMKVLYEEWEKIIKEEINREIEKLPKIIRDILVLKEEITIMHSLRLLVVGCGFWC